MIKRKLTLLNRETVFYLICGMITTIVGIAVFWLCDQTGFAAAVSNTISTIAAVFCAYFLNKVIVFRSVSWEPTVLAREVFAFLTGRLSTYVVETLLLVLLVDVVGLPGTICKTFTSVLVIAGNYLISKKAVFISRKHIPTDETVDIDDMK